MSGVLIQHKNSCFDGGNNLRNLFLPQCYKSARFTTNEILQTNSVNSLFQLQKTDFNYEQVWSFMCLIGWVRLIFVFFLIVAILRKFFFIWKLFSTFWMSFQDIFLWKVFFRPGILLHILKDFQGKRFLRKLLDLEVLLHIWKSLQGKNFFK